jgi:hypothetical protein
MMIKREMREDNTTRPIRKKKSTFAINREREREGGRERERERCKRCVTGSHVNNAISLYLCYYNQVVCALVRVL